MIFKVSLFLTTLSLAEASMRGSAPEEKKQGRKLSGAVPLTTIRPIDGSQNPLGEVDAELQRFSGPGHYPDGQGLGTSFFTTPNPRTISNLVAAQPADHPRASVTDAFWQWGQFMDHDIGLTEGVAEPANIITEGCASFSSASASSSRRDRKLSSGGSSADSFDFSSDPICEIPFARALHHFTPDLSIDSNGVREQLNEITGFVDASMVYGSDATRRDFLRETGTPFMKTQIIDNEIMLPFRGDQTQFAVATNGVAGIDDITFIGGDPRPIEQPGLLAIHTLWVREHNRVAAILEANYSDDADRIFEMTRKIITAEIQHITYNEFLPLMVGDSAPDPTTAAFDSNVNPGVAQEFSACAFRVGHTFLSGDLLLHDGKAATGSINLVDGFFNPQLAVDFPGVIDEVLVGQTKQAANQADIFVIDEVRTNLFGAPVAGTGLDLVALNIARGRDHGLNKYNAVRVGLGLSSKGSFEDVSSDAEVVRRLKAAYGDDGVDLCDAWICGLAEDAAPNAQLGEFFSFIIADQFERYMNGDEFFYTVDPDLQDPTLLSLVNPFTVTYAAVLNANTDTAEPVVHPAMEV